MVVLPSSPPDVAGLHGGRRAGRRRHQARGLQVLGVGQVEDWGGQVEDWRDQVPVQVVGAGLQGQQEQGVQGHPR